MANTIITIGREFGSGGKYIGQRLAEDLGMKLYDKEILSKVSEESGIDLNDCEKVNDGINDLLDKADYIKEQYFLEVSSPGIERILRKDKHLEANIESLVEVKLFKPIEKKNRSAMTIYFATGGERVWDIAYRYGASVGEIKLINDISSDNIENDRMLLVPIN